MATTLRNLQLDQHPTVLLPFDFSESAIAAITTARGLIRELDQLWVLHVIPPIDTSSPGFLFGTVDPVKLCEHADQALAKALTEAGIGEAHRRIVLGEPAEEIITVAVEVGADVIVIPSRGKVGLRRWMIGSVAEKVVRQAPCPVLVLPITDDGHDDDDGDGDDDD